jgi:hypothetical protein
LLAASLKKYGIIGKTMTLGPTAAAIQERVTGVLRSIPKEAFAESFQKLYERCQQCVVKDGDYF